jgi:frataxin-like iron-binding protein CyaY
VDANNLFFIGPTRHQALNVTLPECIVKRGFHIIWIATQSSGSKFSFAHGVLENKKPGVRRVSENDQRVQRQHFIF